MRKIRLRLRSGQAFARRENTQDDCAGVETVRFQERNKKAPWTFQSRTPRQPSPRTAKPRVG